MSAGCLAPAFVREPAPACGMLAGMSSLPVRPPAGASVVILTALAATLARPAPASACGGMVFPEHEQRVEATEVGG